MIQLAGIAAAEPARLADGRPDRDGRWSGARGDAGVWTLALMRAAKTSRRPRGTSHAVKLVREAARPYDTRVEIWLDPARDYLPARATLRSGAGAAEVRPPARARRP